MHAIEGLKHMETAMVPGIYDDSLADETMTVSTEAAHDACLHLSREQGLFAGLSSGGAFVAASRIIERIDEGVVVTIFPDGGDKYLSEGPWNHDSNS